MVGVLLGLPGPWADDERELSDNYTTKIGGVPDWPPFSDEALKYDLLVCRSCGSRLSLVAQIYAPISTESSKIEDRTLYILGCLMPNCGTTELGWSAIRVQKTKSEKESETIPLNEAAEAKPVSGQSPASVSKTKFWNDLDTDSYDDDIDLESLSKALSEVAAAASNSKKQNKKPNSSSGSATKAKPSPLMYQTRVVDDNAPAVPCFYVDIHEEPFSKYDPPNRVGQNDKVVDDDGGGNEEAWDEEKYEHDKALRVDRTYLKFKKRLDANPEQCFRYSYGGKPLLATEEVRVPEKCGLCGASRHYEMQLMPPLLYFLQEAADDRQKPLLDNWDWMTLILYTCSESCSNSVKDENVITGDWTVAEENVSVQYEKPMSLDQVSSYFS